MSTLIIIIHEYSWYFASRSPEVWIRCRFPERSSLKNPVGWKPPIHLPRRSFCHLVAHQRLLSWDFDHLSSLKVTGPLHPVFRRLRFVWLVMVGAEPNIIFNHGFWLALYEFVNGWCGWWFPKYFYVRITENPPTSCKGGRTQKNDVRVFFSNRGFRLRRFVAEVQLAGSEHLCFHRCPSACVLLLGWTSPFLNRGLMWLFTSQQGQHDMHEIHSNPAILSPGLHVFPPGCTQ